MADTFTKKKRSWVMSRIRGRDTKPELIVRSLLHRVGYRFRLHSLSIPGKPDIFLKKHSAVIFVHGCFWHQHPRCSQAVMPKSNKSYWIPKLQRDIERFREVKKILRKAGLNVVVVWECQTADANGLLKYIESRMRREPNPK